jgi:ribosomal protein S18 acetylase RimI-like enzyme
MYKGHLACTVWKKDQEDMLSTVVIRPMRAVDLDKVVEVHRQAFKGFFLDRMGPSFLKQYYATVMDYPASVTLVADQEGEVVGFATGFKNPAGFYAHFRARRLRFVPAILLATLRRPTLIRLVLGNALRMAGRVEPDPRCGELSSIGVLARRGGVGSRLLSAFCESMFSKGADRIILTTDKNENDGTRSFYTAKNFRLMGVERRGDRSLCVYQLDRPDASVT